ncbi:hypothetical protein [Bacillus smithii]
MEDLIKQSEELMQQINEHLDSIEERQRVMEGMLTLLEWKNGEL